MANKKAKPTEDYYDFLPKEVQESTKIKTISEKNVLATLCYERLSHSIYAEQHNGWFYCSHKDIMDGCELESAQLKRVLTKLEIQRLIERKSGTNHRCTHYRLHQAIVERLPKVEGDFVDNEPLVITDNEKSTNEPLVEKPTVETHNEPLDKIRLDESSKDEYSLIEENNVSVAPLGEDATTHKDWSGIIESWKSATKNAKTLEELEQGKRTFMSNGVGMPLEFKPRIESVRDTYDWKYALLRCKH